MWKQDIPMQVNPISLVTVKGASKRIRKPRSLTAEQFRLLVSHLEEPFSTLALMCVCFGLRISEALALKWADVNWIDRTLRVERGIVQQVVDDVKTDDSRKTLTICQDLLAVLKAWKQTSSPGRSIGFLLRRFSLADCRGHTRASKRTYSGPLMPLVLGIFAVTLSDTPTVRGLIQWARRWECNKNSCVTRTSAQP